MQINSISNNGPSFGMRIPSKVAKDIISSKISFEKPEATIKSLEECASDLTKLLRYTYSRIKGREGSELFLKIKTGLPNDKHVIRVDKMFDASAFKTDLANEIKFAEQKYINFRLYKAAMFEPIKKGNLYKTSNKLAEAYPQSIDYIKSVLPNFNKVSESAKIAAAGKSKFTLLKEYIKTPFSRQFFG